ncbi:MAG: GspH/FimT family pseudopilin [Thiobacillus sp.]|nr:GspH/FimT family pseudopilin [Thiobacillus sp.]
MIARQAGFTLLELLVVLALLAMTYALIPPMFAVGGSTAELKAGARQVAAGLRKARSQAIVSRGEATLTLDVEAHSFLLSGDSKPRKLPQQAEIGVYTAQGEVTDASTAAIRFYPDGSSTGGRVSLAMGERKFLVDVDWLTGQVEILDTP